MSTKTSGPDNKINTYSDEFSKSATKTKIATVTRGAVSRSDWVVNGVKHVSLFRFACQVTEEKTATYAKKITGTTTIIRQEANATPFNQWTLDKKILASNDAQRQADEKAEGIALGLALYAATARAQKKAKREADMMKAEFDKQSVGRKIDMDKQLPTNDTPARPSPGDTDTRPDDKMTFRYFSYIE